MGGAPEVVGRYALFGEIASGGMATVHLGRLVSEAGFARTVAIKKLHAHLAKDPSFAAMFLDEARLAARVQHPNVVSTLDVVSQDGELYLVLEYVLGESLAKLVGPMRRSGERVPLRIAATVVTHVLLGLHAAHDATDEHGDPLGIVHRDVSPHNVMVGIDGIARVLDFGVAKAAGRVQTTRDGQIKGKISYMAPEQARAGTTDRRTDVYGASIVLWELLAGARLYSGANDAVVLTSLLAGATTPPSATNPDVPAALDAIVMRGLANDPDKRWQTARDMAIAIEETAPVATARQIGDWVTSVAGDALDARADQVRAIERAAKEADALVRETQRARMSMTSEPVEPPRRNAPTVRMPSAAPAVVTKRQSTEVIEMKQPATVRDPRPARPNIDFPIDPEEPTAVAPPRFEEVVEPATKPLTPLPDNQAPVEPSSQVSSVAVGSPATAPPPPPTAVAPLAPRRSGVVVAAAIAGFLMILGAVAFVRSRAASVPQTPASAPIMSADVEPPAPASAPVVTVDSAAEPPASVEPPRSAAPSASAPLPPPPATPIRKPKPKAPIKFTDPG